MSDDSFEDIEFNLIGIYPNKVEVNGRQEHEALLKDEKRMLELGLDPYFETLIYLKRWGGWLKNDEKNENPPSSHILVDDVTCLYPC